MSSPVASVSFIRYTLCGDGFSSSGYPVSGSAVDTLYPNPASSAFVTSLLLEDASSGIFEFIVPIDPEMLLPSESTSAIRLIPP